MKSQRVHLHGASAGRDDAHTGLLKGRGNVVGRVFPDTPTGDYGTLTTDYIPRWQVDLLLDGVEFDGTGELKFNFYNYSFII